MASIFDLSDSTGASCFTLDLADSHGGLTAAAGRIRLGVNSSSGDDSALLITRSLIGSYVTGSHAVRDESEVTFSGVGLFGYASFDSAVQIDGASAINHAASYQSRIRFIGSGNIANIQGYTHRLTHAGTGTVGQSIGSLYEEDPGNTGTMTTQIGVYFDDLTLATNNFSIYSSGPQASFHRGLWYNEGDVITEGSFSAPTNAAETTLRGHSSGATLKAFQGTNGGFTLEPKGNANADVVLPSASDLPNGRRLLRVTGSGLKPVALGATTTNGVLQSYNGPLAINPQGNAVTIADSGTTTTVAGPLRAQEALWLVDGMTAPSATSGYGKLYIDSADGDLKVIFGNGTVKTIETNP